MYNMPKERNRNYLGNVDEITILFLFKFIWQLGVVCQISITKMVGVQQIDIYNSWEKWDIFVKV